ncbi:hypothetical protein C8J25_109112 [Sphingomonas faeni]|uniref:Uncharacterized protein n=1 Tax=Sphingomonas faeni TaxID=185950 RepID=A0A2T5TZN2_9SPHN|nr:hypothetical protein [Sphingomonas faeni]PTW44682.1 hypothetical protein C8J25_109112 [Sphingomonas faeni]
MLNDVIVFEFENNDGRTVLLDPAIVNELCEALSNVMRTLVEALGQGEADIKYYIVAADRGSVRLALKGIMKRFNGEYGESLENAANVSTLMQSLGPLLITAGLSFGFFISKDDAQARQKTVSVEVSANVVDNAQVLNGIDHLARTALSAGANRVEIRVPDESTCLLNVDAPNSPRFLGIHAQPVDAQEFKNARLELSGRTLDVEYQGKPLKALVGTIKPAPYDTGSIAVVVIWASRFDPPEDNEVVEVSGSFIPNSSGAFKAVGTIHPSDRSIAGVAVVRTRRFDG